VQAPDRGPLSGCGEFRWAWQWAKGLHGTEYLSEERQSQLLEQAYLLDATCYVATTAAQKTIWSWDEGIREMEYLSIIDNTSQYVPICIMIVSV